MCSSIADGTFGYSRSNQILQITPKTYCATSRWNFGCPAVSKARYRADPAARGSSAYPGLPTRPLATHRPALPPSAELFGIRRRSRLPIWVVGGLLDGARAHFALQPMGHARARFRARHPARRRALVCAMALRTVARDE